MGEDVELPFGLASSVGPLPFDAVEDAVDFALSAHQRFPTAPVLSGPDRSLLAQAVDGIDGIRVLAPGALEVDGGHLASSDEVSDAASSVCGTPFAALNAFLDALGARDRRFDGLRAPVRVPVLGPITLTLALTAAGLPLGRAGTLARASTSARAVAVLEATRCRLPGSAVAVVLSEPGLIGSMHPTFPLSRTETRSILDPVIDALDRSPAAAGRLIIGVHVPGRTDWEMLVGSGVSMLSVPVDPALAGWAGSLGGFLEAGGWISWGAVPVDQPLGRGEERLWRRLTATWAELSAAGMDPMLLRLRAMISPADGLAHFGLSQAGQVVDLATSLSVRLRRQTISARLALGA